MVEALRKKSIKKILPWVIILWVLGLLCSGLEISNLLAVTKAPVRFESLEVEEIQENVVVDATIDVNFGAFLEEYEENTKTHTTRTTDMYYVIWTGDDDAVDYRYMGIKVPEYYIYRMDQMTEATYNGELVEAIEFSGAIKKMDTEEFDYLKEYFLMMDFTEEELPEYIIPYYIDCGALVGGAATTVYVIFGLGLVFIVLGIIILINAIRGGSLKKFKKELEALGISEDSADVEYENARIIGDIRIGSRLTFYMLGSTPHVVLNDKLVWAYQHTTTHRTNGIKTGTTYAVVLGTSEKKLTNVTVKNESAAISVLENIQQCMPWVVLGYSDDLRNLYNKDMANFLEIVYNKVKNGQQF